MLQILEPRICSTSVNPKLQLDIHSSAPQSTKGERSPRPIVQKRSAVFKGAHRGSIERVPSLAGVHSHSFITQEHDCQWYSLGPSMRSMS